MLKDLRLKPAQRLIAEEEEIVLHKKCWGVAELADAPGCFPGDAWAFVLYRGGSNPSAPAIFKFLN